MLLHLLCYMPQKSHLALVFAETVTDVTKIVTVHIFIADWKYLYGNWELQQNVDLIYSSLMGVSQTLIHKYVQWAQRLYICARCSVSYLRSKMCCRHVINRGLKSLWSYSFNWFNKRLFNGKQRGWMPRLQFYSPVTSFGPGCRPQRWSSEFQQTRRHQANAMWHSVFLLCTLLDTASRSDIFLIRHNDGERRRCVSCLRAIFLRRRMRRF